MKVVHIASSIFGGAGIGMMRYHRSLLSMGGDSRIIARDITEAKNIQRIFKPAKPVLRRVGDRLGLPLSEEAKMRQKIEELDSQAENQAQYELFSLPFSDYCPENHPWVQEADIINIHWVAGILDWQRFFKSVNKPIVFTLHDQQHYLGGFHYSLDRDNNAQMTAIENQVKEIKKQSLSGHRVAVIANSQWNAREARQSGFFSPDTPIETIYYPLDTSVFKPRPKLAAKQTFGIDPNRRVVGFACENLDNFRKGFDDLIEAIALLPDDVRTNTTLLSFGKAPSVELKSKVLMPWVHLGFLNSETTQVAAYSAMDIFVIPSRAEAFGQTALEAITCGTRVIGTNVGGIPEAIKTSKNSVLYSNGNIKELASLLEIAANNDQQLLGTYFERLRNQHSLDNCAKLHLKLYDSLI
jgi:glycosyltransferase involved in cell wall biosynthesis